MCLLVTSPYLLCSYLVNMLQAACVCVYVCVKYGFVLLFADAPSSTLNLKPSLQQHNVASFTTLPSGVCVCVCGSGYTMFL